MSNNFLLLPAALMLMFSVSSSWASGGGHEGRHHSHGHHKHRDENYYPPAPYYGAVPQPVYRDPRSHQGLAGGVVGSVLGYELGNGNPLATGIGAAAGSYVGNEVSGRR